MKTEKTKFETINELAAYYDTFFTVKTRNNGETFVCTKEDRPEELRDLIHDAHEDNLPEDWTYLKINQVIEAIGNEEDPRDTIEVDIYTKDLLNWCHGRTHLVDEALQEYHCTNLINAIQYAQQDTINRIAQIVEDKLQEILDSQVDEEEEGLE
jgi:hypothetical protein